MKTNGQKSSSLPNAEGKSGCSCKEFGILMDKVKELELELQTKTQIEKALRGELQKQEESKNELERQLREERKVVDTLQKGTVELIISMMMEKIGIWNFLFVILWPTLTSCSFSTHLPLLSIWLWTINNLEI